MHVTPSLNQYNAINRWSIHPKEEQDNSTQSKQKTVDQLRTLLTSDNHKEKKVAIHIIKILIEFKDYRKYGSEQQQETTLKTLKTNLQKLNNPQLKYENLLNLVRNQSYLFQRSLPTTFKNFLIEIQRDYPYKFDRICDGPKSFLRECGFNIAKAFTINDLTKIGETLVDDDRNSPTSVMNTAYISTIQNNHTLPPGDAAKALMVSGAAVYITTDQNKHKRYETAFQRVTGTNPQLLLEDNNPTIHLSNNIAANSQILSNLPSRNLIKYMANPLNNLDLLGTKHKAQSTPEEITRQTDNLQKKKQQHLCLKHQVLVQPALTPKRDLFHLATTPGFNLTYEQAGNEETIHKAVFGFSLPELKNEVIQYCNKEDAADIEYPRDASIAKALASYKAKYTLLIQAAIANKSTDLVALGIGVGDFCILGGHDIASRTFKQLIISQFIASVHENSAAINNAGLKIHFTDFASDFNSTKQQFTDKGIKYHGGREEGNIIKLTQDLVAKGCKVTAVNAGDIQQNSQFAYAKVKIKAVEEAWFTENAILPYDFIYGLYKDLVKVVSS